MPTEKEYREAVATQNTVRDPLLQEREKTHGSFRQNAEIMQKLLGVLKDYDLQFFNPSQRTAIEMICLKLGRTMSNPTYKDNWDDIAGYAKLGAEACETIHSQLVPGGMVRVP